MSNEAVPVTSADWFKEAKRLIPGGVNSPVRAFRSVGGEPFFVKCAQGGHIWDVEDRRYIDYVGTWGPAILGHAAPAVVRAVQDAAPAGLSFGIPNVREVEMARLITSWVPSVEKVRMVNSGTEATMSCIRLARGFTARSKIVKFEGCYHGHVDSLLVKAGSGALTFGTPDSAGVPAELAALTITLPYNVPEALESTFREVGREIAAVIVEAVPANAGLFLPRPGYYERLRDLCSAHGALLIFDEVMTGFRLAKGGYQELCGIVPDLTAMGKVIGGGLPVGAFGGRAEIMDHLSPDGPVYQAGTLSGNPLAMAAGLAQLREMERINGWQHLENLGADFEARTRAVLKRCGKPFDFKRIGSMFCLYFAEGPIWNLADAQRSDRSAFNRFFHQAREAGVYFAPSQFEAGFLCVAHTEEDFAETGRVMERCLTAV
jgi:glutamate-1-semialdehyde 2,1-aminomutase